MCVCVDKYIDDIICYRPFYSVFQNTSIHFNTVNLECTDSNKNNNKKVKKRKKKNPKGTFFNAIHFSSPHFSNR